jgi:CO/xanthine dehydrogenase FAD-binding subunit
MEHPTEGGTRLIVYANYNEDEPTHIIKINKNKED